MSSEPDTPETLAAKYIKGCWILKIRLMSARRLLWQDEFSLIQFEQAVLQIRKITEGYAQLNLLLSQLEHPQLPKTISGFYEPPKILKALRKLEKKPKIARVELDLKGKSDTRNEWHMKFNEVSSEDEHRICFNWNQCGRFLHDRITRDPMISEEDMASVLFENQRNLRIEHQWLWNLLWRHGAQLRTSKIFFVDFGDDTSKSRPILGKQSGSIDVAKFEFHPEMYSDFTGDVDWKHYTG